jgi:hypothetical protein
MPPAHEAVMYLHAARVSMTTPHFERAYLAWSAGFAGRDTPLRAVHRRPTLAFP